MITGDNPLTACHVAKELGIAKKPLRILEKLQSGNWEWRSLANSNEKVE